MRALQTKGKVGFGVLIHFTFPLIILETYNKYKKVAKALESYDFDSLWFNDHFWTFPEPTEKPVYETLTLMSAIATETEEINLGTMVLSQSYRNPAMLAKQTACIDQISKGRLILGIGAGWYEEEHLAYGYDFFKTGKRMAQLDDTIQIIKAMWLGETPSFDGKYYRIENAQCLPKPFQSPRPPILIGGSGEKKTLRLVANYADAANIMGNLGTIQNKYNILKEHCNAVNRSYSEIRKTTNVFVHIGETKQEVEKDILWYKNNHPREHIRNQTIEEYLSTRVHGTPDECIKGIQNYIDIGMEYLVFMFPRLSELKGPKLFAKEVLPSFN